MVYISVLKNLRNETKAAFVREAEGITKSLSKHTKKLPKKLQPYLSEPVEHYYYNAYTNIILGNSCDVNFETEKQKRLKHFYDALNDYREAQESLYSFWNVANVSGDTIAKWVKSTNSVMRKLGGTVGLNKQIIPYIRKLDKRTIKKAKFVEAVADLHNYTLHQLGYVNNIYRNVLCVPISKYMSRALFCTIEGNRFHPNNNAACLYRYRNFLEALSNLNAMQTPIMSLFTLGQIGAEYQTKWCEKFNTAMKLMNGIIKYEKERIRTLGLVDGDDGMSYKFDVDSELEKYDELINKEIIAEMSKKKRKAGFNTDIFSVLTEEGLTNIETDSVSDEELGIEYQDVDNEIKIIDKYANITDEDVQRVIDNTSKPDSSNTKNTSDTSGDNLSHESSVNNTNNSNNPNGTIDVSVITDANFKF